MAELRQQYLEILQGYGVDPAGLRNATEAQLRRIMKQTAQGPDIGGEAASGAAAAQQAAQDVIGGTTPVRPLEELLAEAHTLPAVEPPAGGWPPTIASETRLPFPEVDIGSIYDVSPVDERIEQDRLRRAEETEAARLAKQPKAQIAPGHTITADTGDKNLLQNLGGVKNRLVSGITAVTPGAMDWGTPVTGATDEEKDIVRRQVLGQDIENVRGGGTPMTTFIPDAWSSEPVDPRVADILGELTDAEKEQYLLKYGGSEEEIIRAIEEGVLPSGAPRVQRDAAVERPSTPVSARRADTTDLTVDTPDDVDLMDVDLAGMAPPGQRGLLGRLGKMISDNPEIAAQIAQAAGGLMSGVAGGRAQRKAGRETEQRVSRANLISALTGGRVRPQVTAAEADEGGLLSRLGQITTAGGRIATGEMERRRAEDIEERELGLKGRQVGTMERRIEVMQDKVTKDHEVGLADAEAVLAEATGASYERVQGGIDKLNKATNIYKGGGYLDPTQGHKNLYGQMRVLWADYEEDATPANVGAIFQVYQRFFDPATVREGDLRILQESEGMFRRLQAQAERLVGEGGSLSSDTVEEMKRITDKVHDLQARKAMEDVTAYIDVAIAPQDRDATMQYYDKIFRLPPLMEVSGAAELTTALESGEIVLD